MRRGALQPLRRCDVRADIKEGCDLIPRNEAALAKGREGPPGEGGRCRAEEGGANAWKRGVENVTVKKKECFRQ